MRHLTVSLISLNQEHHLRKLLPSLFSSLSSIDAEVLLVANRCTDESVSYVKENFPSLKVTINNKITGYGGNHNINLKKANSEYFVIMNSDMLVNSDTFNNLLNFLKKQPDVGMVAPRVLNEDGTIQYLVKRYPTVLNLFLRKFCPQFIRPLFKKKMEFYEMRDANFDDLIEAELLSGSFMLARTNLLKKIDGFDEKFFLYFEDYDLCRRIQARGLKTIYYPGSKAIHFWERSAHKSWKFAFMFLASAFKYFNRWGWKWI